PDHAALRVAVRRAAARIARSAGDHRVHRGSVERRLQHRLRLGRGPAHRPHGRPPAVAAACRPRAGLRERAAADLAAGHHVVDRLTALIADIGLALSYVAYAFVFNLAYDRAFPIAAPAPDPAPRIETDADLSALNTLGLRARAARLAVIERADQVAALTARADWAGTPRLVLGGGSNVVLDGDFPGWVLRVAIPGREQVGEDDTAVLVRAGGGENWHDFVRWTLEQGWGGLENLSLIPGTVGAAPIQNIGAYGLELAERFDHLEAVSLEDGRVRRFDAAD